MARGSARRRRRTSTLHKHNGAQPRCLSRCSLSTDGKDALDRERARADGRRHDASAGRAVRLDHARAVAALRDRRGWPSATAGRAVCLIKPRRCTRWAGSTAWRSRRAARTGIWLASVKRSGRRRTGAAAKSIETRIFLVTIDGATDVSKPPYDQGLPPVGAPLPGGTATSSASSCFTKGSSARRNGAESRGALPWAEPCRPVAGCSSGGG